MRPGVAVRRHSAGCEIRGCHSASAHYLVTHSGVTRRVCRTCMLEMTALYGWTYSRAATQPDLRVRVPVISTLN